MNKPSDKTCFPRADHRPTHSSFSYFLFLFLEDSAHSEKQKETGTKHIVPGTVHVVTFDPQIGSLAVATSNIHTPRSLLLAICTSHLFVCVSDNLPISQVHMNTSKIKYAYFVFFQMGFGLHYTDQKTSSVHHYDPARAWHDNSYVGNASSTLRLA